MTFPASSPSLSPAAPGPGAFVGFGGSYVGSAHRRVGRNNQDAWAVGAEEGLGVAVVCDGCSAGRASEIGAGLAARWLLAHLPGLWRAHGPHEAALAVGRGLADLLDRLCGELGPAPTATLAELGLFTFLAAIVDDERWAVLGLGDGLVGVNGRFTVLEPDADGAPDYIAYRLVPDEELLRSPRLDPSVLAEGATADLDSLVVATDGARRLLAPDDEVRVDGQAVRPALVERLLDPGPFLKNPSLFEKRLRVLAEGRGLLDDDTTLAVIARAGARRSPGGGS